MRRGGLIPRCAVALAALVHVAPAGAQPAPGEQTMATALFREGRRLMAEGRFAEACPKLAESQRLSPGGGTLLNLAICHEKEGKTATAWFELNEALAIARKDGRADREQLARERLAAVEPVLPKLTIVVPREADVPSLEIVLDTVPVRRAVWGTTLPVDPGPHVVTASAPAREPWRHEAAIVAGQSVVVQVPPLVEVAPSPSPSPPPPAHPAVPEAPPPASRLLPDRPVATSPEPSRSHVGQLGALARADVEAQLRGVAFVVGPTYGVTRHLDVGVAAILGSSVGAHAGVVAYALDGPLKPALTLGVPVFFVDGVWPGGHAAAGLQWDPLRQLGVFLLAGVQYFPEVPEGYAHVMFVPSAGFQVRL